MKKKILIGFIFLITGLIVGNNLYNKVDFKLLQTFNETNKYYILQQGVYNDKDSMQSQTRDVNPKISFYNDGKYYVYVGITGNLKNAEKIKNIFEEEGIDIYLKEIILKDEEFISNLSQFDILIENTSNEQEILTIEEVVLSNYEKKLENN